VATTPAYYGDFSDRDQPTLGSVAKLVSDARTLLQDTVAPYRYNDPSLLVSLNVTMLETSRLRSDLFVFNNYGGQPPSFQAVDDTSVDIEPQFRLAILHGICGHALERDQEDYQDARASAFLGLFTAGLIGHAIGPISGGSPPSGKKGDR
jgi:hypothetical protein